MPPVGIHHLLELSQPPGGLLELGIHLVTSGKILRRCRVAIAEGEGALG
jgi:hypothetical protein